MNYNYARRAQTVQAFQMTKERRADSKDWPGWLHEAWNRAAWSIGSVFPEFYPRSSGDDRVAINTASSFDIVQWGWWIVRDETGALLVLDDSQFQFLYAPLGGLPDDFTVTGHKVKPIRERAYNE